MEELEKPDKKIYYWWISEMVILSFVIAIPILYFSFLSSVGVFLVLTGLGFLYSRFRYKAWGFEVRDEYLYIQYGVLRKVRVMAPFVRIQHVDTQRGPVARMLGLSSLVVYTAGSRGADVRIPGLLRNKAEEMQEKLRDIAIESESSDAV